MRTGRHQVGRMDTVLPELRGPAFSLEQARAVALAMPNRGPLRFVDGEVDPKIKEHFDRFGFYVLTGVLQKSEFARLRDDVEGILLHATAAVDELPGIVQEPGRRMPMIVPQPEPLLRAEGPAWMHHRPRSQADDGTMSPSEWQPGMMVSAAAPLATDNDPNGRNPSAMATPKVPSSAEDRRVLRSIMSWGRLSGPAFALLGHPGLLSLVEAVLGEDFTVFGGVHSELLIKVAGLAPSVAWHQDGQTHVRGNRGADLHRHPHGFNLFCNLDETTPENSLWVVPHSHTWGHLDIPSLVEAHGERLPTALPVLTQPGDIAISR